MKPANHVIGRKTLPLLVLGLVLLGAGPRLHAQEGAPPAGDAAAERDRQYEALAEDVEAMDRLLGLVKRVVKLVTPSVVHIEARPIRELRVRSDVQEAGSGVVVQFSPGGEKFILTNRHVIKNSAEPHIRVQLYDGRRVNPTQIWSDPYTDVAVMRVDAVDLTPARLGDSGVIEVGDPVLAVGSPFGLSQSVTQGIISAMGRYNLELGEGEVKYQNFLQTDAAINPGNSGGPLINMRGEVIGLNTAIASNSGGNEGIGFSIPINIAVRIGSQLTSNGSGVEHWGYLGVKLDGLFDERRARAAGLSRLIGARVKSVEPNSPAALADVQAEDIIVEYNGVRIEDDDHLISMVKLTEAGREMELLVYRNGQPLKRRVRIGDTAQYKTPAESRVVGDS